jgi:peroxiredoxin
MKQLFCYLFLLLFSYTIAAQTNNTFTVNGSINVKVGEEDTISLSYTDPSGVKISDKQITQNGKFTFTGEVCHPYWARFNCEKSKANGAFLIEPSNIDLVLSAKSPFLTSVKGSKTHDEYVSFKKTFRPDLNKQSDSIYALIKTINTKNPTEEEIRTRRSLYNAVEKITEQKSLNYIKANPNSFVSITLARGLYIYDPTVEELEYVYSLLGTDAKKTLIGKQLESYVYKTKYVDTGKTLPNFTLPNSNAKNISLSSVKNKYILVDFWYTGCAPCVAQFPKLRQLHKKYKTKFEIIGVSHDGKKYRNKWLTFLKKTPTGWIQLLDTDNAVCDRFGIESFPSNFLLNKKGVIVAKNVSEKEIEAFLEANN